jgi:MoaA/NifB/PqqE/SkfB family radical SAM enzyme
MTVRTLFSRMRRKAIRILLGKELFSKLNNNSNNNSEDMLRTIDANINRVFNIALGNSDSHFNSLKKIIPRPVLQQVSVHLTDHCDLNCQNCSHFSTLVKEPVFLDVVQFEKDFQRFAELTQGRVNTIELMGGEPLLHPDVPAIMEIARRSFPKTLIKFVTNGIKLKQQPDSFWIAAYNNKIRISPTKYPVNIPWDEIKKIAEKHNVCFEFFNGGNEIKTSYHTVLDLQGTQEPVSAFLNCNHSHWCCNIRGGKLYPCPIIAYTDYFNAYFNQELAVTNADYIDIYENYTPEEIFSFFAKPTPFCRYCNTHARTWNHPWAVTQHSIKEWTL